MTEPYYQDDYVTLYHGNCLEITEWLSADVLVTDPPYGISYVSSSSRYRRTDPIAGDGDTDIRDDALSLWGGKPALIFGSWKVQKPAKVRLTLIWDKGDYPGSGDVSLPWGPSSEEIYVLGEWPRISPGGRRREGGRPARGSSVIRVEGYNPASADRPSHPTPKPVALMSRLLEKTAGAVADPFAGSGATLIAARNLSRPAIGVEVEERYCELIASRLSQQAFDFGALSGG